MPQALAPFLLTNVSLTLRKDGAAGAAAEYRCQLGKAQITPSASGGNSQTYDTFCESFSSSSGGTTFTLDLGGFQAYADVADLSNIMWDDAGEKYEFVLTPLGGVISATNPGFSGVVTMAEAPVGGTARQYATFEVSLACEGKPEKITAPPVAARSARAESKAKEPADAAA